MRCFLVRNHQQFPNCCGKICRSRAPGLPGLCNSWHGQGGAWWDQRGESPCREIPGPQMMFKEGGFRPTVLSSQEPNHTREFCWFSLMQRVTPGPWGQPDVWGAFSAPRNFRLSLGVVVLLVPQAVVFQRVPALCLWLIMTRKTPCSGFIMNNSAPWKS